MVSTRKQSKQIQHAKHIRELHTNPFRSLGLYYGYPQCCINYFVGSAAISHKNSVAITCEKKRPSRVQSRVSQHSGFIHSLFVLFIENIDEANHTRCQWVAKKKMNGCKMKLLFSPKTKVGGGILHFFIYFCFYRSLYCFSPS